MLEFQEDIEKRGIGKAIKKRNQKENRRYYPYQDYLDKIHDTQWDYEHMPLSYWEYPKVDKITDDWVNGWGEFGGDKYKFTNFLFTNCPKCKKPYGFSNERIFQKEGYGRVVADFLPCQYCGFEIQVRNIFI